MKREAVKTSNLASIGYDAEKMTLDVEFLKGGIYRYYDVPGGKYFSLMSAESVDKYYSAEIMNVYKSDKISTLEFVTDNLTEEEKELLLSHFDSIYECKELTDHEYRIIYLAWLWANGLVFRDEDGMSTIYEKTSDIPASAYEITFEDDMTGGVNLDLTYMYYSLDKIIDLMKWKE